MAVTQVTYTGNGSTTNYSFTFPYLDKSDVRVKVNGTTQNTTEYSFANATTVAFNTAPANNSTIIVYRDTDNDTKKGTFYAGSAIKAEDLNDNFDQILYVAQEVDNNAMSTLGTSSMQGDMSFGKGVGIVFEGDTDDAYEVTIKGGDPTADRTITFPDNTGTVITTGSANVVDSDHYVDGSIDSAHIANDQIDSQHYAAGSIDQEHMSANSINSDQYVAGSIDRVHLSADIIDGTKIEDNAINSKHYAAGSIDLEHMSANSVDSDQYVDGSIDAVHLSSGSVTNAKLDTDSVTSGKIADNAVDSEHYVDGSIDEVHLATNSVARAKIQDNAINGDKIGGEAIDSEHYIDGSIDREHLAADIIDATKIADNAVTTDHIADAELTTLAGMQSGTASVLAGSTALTATLSELNTICDGKTIQTTITDTDTSYPTSGAVVDYVSSQITPLGGFEAIANEDSFPADNPAAGVIISIANADGILVDNEGVSETASNTASNSDNIRITGFPASLTGGSGTNANPFPLPDNTGLLVVATGTQASGKDVYTFHRLLPTTDDVKQLSDDVNDFFARYRINAGEPSSNNDDGDLVWDTNANKMKVYDSTASAWKEVTSVGDFKFLIPVDAGTTTAATWDGSDTSFDLKEGTNSGSAASINSVYQLMISVNGVIQKPNTGTYSASNEGFHLTDSDTIRFCTAPPTGSSVFIIQLGAAVSLNAPADDSVSTVKLQNLAVTGDKIATNLDIADSKTLRFGTDNDISCSYNNSDNSLNITGGSGKTIKIHSGADLELSCETNVTGAYDINFVNTTADPDQDALYLGYQHGGHGSRIGNKHSSGLKIWSDHGKISKESNTGFDYIVWNDGTSVELYYADNKKFETTNTGVQVTGKVLFDSDNYIDCNTTANTLEIFLDGGQVGEWGAATLKLLDNKILKIGSGNDLQIYHDETDTYFKNHTTGSVYHRARANWNVSVNATDGGADDAIKALQNGSVELYNDGVQKLETNASGVDIGLSTNACHLMLFDSGEARFGNGQDFKIYHDGTNNYIDAANNHATIIKSGTSDLFLQGNPVWITDEGNSHTYFKGTSGGAVELYYDNNKKFETYASGIYIGDAAVNQALPVGTNHSGFAFSSDQFYTSTTGTSTNTQVRFYNGNGLVGSVTTDGSATAYNTSSDYRLKENEVAISDGITRLKTLKPYRFNFKADSSKTLDGFFAHEVTPAVPEAVSGEKDGEEMQAIDQSKLVPLLTAALQEAITKIETLETKVAALEAK